MTPDAPEPPHESRFWRSVIARLTVVACLGGASVLWFRGCLVPQIRDEVQQDQQKAAETTGAAR